MMQASGTQIVSLNYLVNGVKNNFRLFLCSIIKLKMFLLLHRILDVFDLLSPHHARR